MKYYSNRQNWDDHPPSRSYVKAAKGFSRDSRPCNQEITELNNKFDKFSSEAIRLFESITVEFNIFKEKQQLIEAQSNLLITKVQCLESERHSALKDAKNFIKTHNITEQSLAEYKEEEGNTLRVALENSYHDNLLKETQTLNAALVQQQEMAGKIDQLFTYMKDIFIGSSKPES
jgi:hypothetical protein